MWCKILGLEFIQWWNFEIAHDYFWEPTKHVVLAEEQSVSSEIATLLKGMLGYQSLCFMDQVAHWSLVV